MKKNVVISVFCLSVNICGYAASNGCAQQAAKKNDEALNVKKDVEHALVTATHDQSLTQALMSKSALLGASAGFLVARIVKASLPMQAVVVSGGYLAGISHDLKKQWERLLKARKHVGNLEHFSYGEELKKHVAFVDRALYGRFVEQLPICCVDVFVYDTTKNTYFMVKRDQDPCKNVWWFVGGRLNKGEDFAACTRRKCKAEVGLDVEPIAQLGAYSTTFDTSAWECGTHTVNVATLALLESGSTVKLDPLHNNSKWCSLNETPSDAYLKAIYQNALLHLSKNKKSA
jgi:ADP-ribose pyrophosphatase YjhB (NUDIX family)